MKKDVIGGLHQIPKPALGKKCGTRGKKSSLYQTKGKGKRELPIFEKAEVAKGRDKRHRNWGGKGTESISLSELRRKGVGRKASGLSSVNRGPPPFWRQVRKEGWGGGSKFLL